MIIHSISDVITNSSSVEYCHGTEGSVNIVKTIISQILLGAGILESVDTLFKVELIPDEDANGAWDGFAVKVTSRSGEDLTKLNTILQHFGIEDAL